MLTQVQTTWGSRDGADADDGVRMIRLPQYGSNAPDGRKSETFECHYELMQQLPAYDTHNLRTSVPIMSLYYE